MKTVITKEGIDSFKKIMNIGKFWRYAFWEDKYYELKWIFWALRKYFKISSKMRPWDGVYIFEMTKHQLEILLPKIENGYEEEKARNKKVKDIKRLIELLNHAIEDDYINRCGYNYNYELKLGDKIEDIPLVPLISTATEEQNENNTRALKASIELEKYEHKEIGKLYTKIPEWWN